MAIKHITFIVCYAILLGLLIFPLSASAQEMTREERIKALEKLKMEDKLWEENTIGKLSADMPLELQTFELPPLSVFLDAVTENATVKRAQSEV